MTTKKANLAGPGVGSYEELEKVLPQDYTSLLRRLHSYSPVDFSNSSSDFFSG